jgi:acyl carrier protein
LSLRAPRTPRPRHRPSRSAGRDYLAELVKIASERTGYEPDMLDLDAGIEADLGIDSIKRVEILTALQQRSTPAEQAQIQGAMEKLTSARTLREIAERIAAAWGSRTPQPAPAGPSSALHPDHGRQAAQPVQAAILSGPRLPDHR